MHTGRAAGRGRRQGDRGALVRTRGGSRATAELAEHSCTRRGASCANSNVLTDLERELLRERERSQGLQEQLDAKRRDWEQASDSMLEYRSVS